MIAFEYPSAIETNQFTVTEVPKTFSCESYDCIKIHMSGAVYSITDMIIFELFKDLSDNKLFLNVIVTLDDIREIQNIFEWDDVPQDVMDIYNYVNQTSTIEQENDSYILYGSHIGRAKDHRYNLMTFFYDPLNHLEIISPKDPQDIKEDVLSIYSDISTNMKIVKKIC